MRKVIWAIFLALSSLTLSATPGTTQPATEPAMTAEQPALLAEATDLNHPAVALTEKLDCDLQADPRPQMEVKGPVDWRQGRLAIGTDASAGRKLECGAQAKLVLRLAFPVLRDGQTSCTRLKLHFGWRGDLIAQMTRRRNQGKNVAELQLIDEGAPVLDQRTGLTQKLPSTLRTYLLNGDFPDGTWTFIYNYGLLSIYAGDRRLGIAYADKEPTRQLEAIPVHLRGYWLEKGADKQATTQPKPSRVMRSLPLSCLMFYDFFGVCEPLELTGWTLEQEGAPLACLGISGVASPSYRKTLLSPTFGNQISKVEAEARAGLTMTLTQPDGKKIKVNYPGVSSWRSRGQNILRTWMDHPEPWAQQELSTRPLSRFEYEPPFCHVGNSLGEKHPYFAMDLAGLGMQCHWAAQDADAEKMLTQAVNVASQSLGTLHPDFATITAALARFYRETGRPKEAAPLLTQVLRSARDVFGTRSIRYMLAIRESAYLDRDRGRLAEAEVMLRPIIEICREASPRDKIDLMPAMVALGELEVRLGEDAKADAVLGQAQEDMENIVWHHVPLPSGQLRAPGITPEQAALVYGDLATAEVLRAWIKFRDGKRDEADKLAGAANAMAVGLQRDAWGNQVPTVYAAAAQHAECGPALASLADLFVALGHPRRALDCVEAWDALPGTPDYDLAAVCRTMGKICEAAPDRDKVFVTGRYYRDSKRQRLEMAYSVLKEHPEILKEHPELGRSVPSRVVFWYENARQLFEQTVGREHPDTIDAMRLRSQAEWKESGPKNALPMLRDANSRAVALTERVLFGLPETEAYSVVRADRPLADLLLSCLRATGEDHSREAYEIVFRGKALATQILVERRQIALAAGGSPDVARLSVELDAKRGELARLSLAAPTSAQQNYREKLGELLHRKEELEHALAQLSEPYRRSRAEAQVGIDDLARRLPPKTAVVDLVERWQWTAPTAAEPWTRERCYDAFVLLPAKASQPPSVTWLSLGAADPVDALLDRWIAGVRGGKPENASGLELRRRIWEPIETRLNDSATVLLVPDGRLSQVPWTALPGRKAGSYLIEDYAIAQSPYGQQVASLLAAAPVTGDKFLLLGGVDYGPGEKWKPLAGTVSEVRQLEKLRPGAGTTVLEGSAATKTLLMDRLPHCRFVHLATHGEFLAGDPTEDTGRFLVADRLTGGASLDVAARNPLLLSMVVLAGANRPATVDARGLPIGSDGFLTAEEVIGMDLSHTELVVLSACETGVGAVRPGEGVFSLQRAFQMAGSRAVVATQWSIADQPTQLLMKRFYENLWTRQMGRLASLREAQIWMLGQSLKSLQERGVVRDLSPGEATSSNGRLPPRYWAAFVLSGDWR